MPNWCSNHIIVEGNAEEVNALLDKASLFNEEEQEANVFSFDKVFPTPEKHLNGDGWYEWRIQNWGTKWDLEQSAVKLKGPFTGGAEGNQVFELFYETAWAPAVNFWVIISQMFPSLKITQEFFEEGDGFIGQVYLSHGETEIVEDNLTNKHYLDAGAVFDYDGDIDWDESEGFNMWSLFPLGED